MENQEEIFRPEHRKSELSPEQIAKLEKADALARQILEYARNTLFMNLRFMKNALGRCDFVPYMGTVSADALCFYYNPLYILKEFEKNQNRITRTYLHMVLHCIFQHQFVSPYIRRNLWNLSCDIAVEKMIQELHFDSLDKSPEAKQARVLQNLEQNVKYMTAEKIYDYFTNQNLSDEDCEQMQKLFEDDNHNVWYEGAGESILTELQSGKAFADKMNGKNGMHGDSEQDDFAESEAVRKMWQKLSQQIQVDLETFSQQYGKNAGSMMQNLLAVNRERCNYENFLRKFAVRGEVMKVDTDSFDYNFYCYGRSVYEEVALIEPLEYKDVKRIREFVIAIDTSGSVAGKTVQKFIQKTYNILKSQESFFSKVNIHIIQCDTVIQEDVKITSQEEFDEYLKHMTLKGFGGTDFRPVFGYVDNLIKKKEFTNLKGLLYFTDGCGIFPIREPDYKTAFVFVDDGYNNYDVPVWAIRVMLTTDDIMEG
ncbi:MAG: metallopeptidase [Oscillospiraceae bacterium]|nr:metallopeptidase [Oscillospiraceae bacterium]